MSTANVVGAILLLVLSALALWLVVPPKPRARRSQPGSALSYETVERAAMPAEIANGKLVISEKTCFRRGRRPFAAKTDQGFLTPEGWIVMVESKTRGRVSPGDIVQVSCQAMAVAYENPKWRVADWGYVRLAPAGRRPYYQRVDLVHPSRIDQLWDRWKALKEGRIVPIARPKPYRCGTCVARTQCRAAVR